MVVLHYIGNGAAMPNIPARDLLAYDIANLLSEWGMDTAAVLATGLYATP